ncbi:MAG: hypothetical protein IMZ55_08700 [Acidobacteria bacterium]|nr:hypothetical protein [Acidobacteriota bacterium]
MPRTVGLLLASLVFLACPCSVLAATPEEERQAMYGEQYTKVRASRDFEDNAALASELIAAAKQARPEYAALLCDWAYELADNRAGWDKAAEALELKAEKVPTRKAEALENAVKVRSKQMAIKSAPAPARAAAAAALIRDALAAAEAYCQAADIKASAMVRQAEQAARTAAPERLDEVRDARNRITYRLRIEMQAQPLVERLKQSPDDEATRTKLVHLMVIDLDAPERAVAFLEGSTDAKAVKYVPAAAKPLDEAPELVCKELGEWYAGLAEDAPLAAKEAMLVRAWRYLGRYLCLHEAKDLARSESAKVNEKVEAALDKLGPPKGLVVGPGRWISLLPRVNLTEDGLSKNWTTEGAAFVLLGTGKLRVPCQPCGDYQLKARLVVMKATADRRHLIAYNLPVGEYGGSYSFADGGVFGGIPGTSAVPPPGEVSAGKEYRIDIRVASKDAEAEILVQVNGEQHLRWTGNPSSLKWAYTQDMPETTYLGIGAFEHPEHPKVAFVELRLRMISGKAVLLR